MLAVYIYVMGSIMHMIANREDGMILQRNSWPIYVPGFILIVALIALEIIAIRKVATKKQ
jgi:hypothetical protein